MLNKSEIIVVRKTSVPDAKLRPETRDLNEIAIVFVLILATVWTPQGRLNELFSLSAALCVLSVALSGRWKPREMGLAQPLAGAGEILFVGAVLYGAIWGLGHALRPLGPSHPIPWTRSWQYAIWALVQQFILQSIFFIRLESVVGSRHAVFWSAALYALAHLPSPMLTIFSFLGGFLFCQLFRRWRNIFPLGIIHAALGLITAASLPDKWLHHMRVGIGYLAGQR